MNNRQCFSCGHRYPSSFHSCPRCGHSTFWPQPRPPTRLLDIQRKLAEIQLSLDVLKSKLDAYTQLQNIDNEQAGRIRQQIEQLQERLQNE
jgi:predicted  nucleic acid-binding Zn-ribbon protein